MSTDIILNGMLGMGDNFHQRAVVKSYLNLGYKVSLITAWPQIYYDLPVNIVLAETNLRTQKKNIKKYSNKLKNIKNIHSVMRRAKKIWYTRSGVIANKSILIAMIQHVGLENFTTDFSFPIKPEWSEKIKKTIELKNINNLPILFYRPLVERTEWDGCSNRNPDKVHYFELINYIKDRFFVVSVADTVENVEWISSDLINADLEFHKGELSFEELCGLMSISGTVFCSPGFSLVMAQAIGTPSICVYGGRENSQAYEVGSKLTPSLGIDPIESCLCFDHTHNCDKTIDIKKAKKDIDHFIGSI